MLPHCLKDNPPVTSARMSSPQKNTLWCFLHSCEANDGFFSRDKLQDHCCHQATSQQKTKHRSLRGAVAAPPPPGHLVQLQGPFCCSASLPHHMPCLTRSQSHQKKARRSLGTFATLSSCNAAGVSTPWALRTPLPSWCLVWPLPVCRRGFGKETPTWAGASQGFLATAALPGGMSR